jgi:hypothetical protein
VESIISVWLVAENPTITIIAIAATTPARTPIFLLGEKLTATLLFESELLVVGFDCNLILVTGRWLDNDLSNGWFFRYIVINDST